MSKQGGANGDIEAPVEPDTKTTPEDFGSSIEPEPKTDNVEADHVAEVQAGALDVEGAAAASVPHKVTYKDLFLRFVWMGWVAFGGPTAHIALFQKCVLCP
ncbi:hypothetical protein WJX75_005838 [Coccomyxa subellipsoidea]|uniref:Uncharacterized protein n=1 Tax=Coccomyxa subellipsoidea TaxID=248742 RepID=A0ABR2YBS8_9CHLO